MLVHCRFTPPALHVSSLITIYTPGWRDTLWELSVLLKSTTQCPQPELKPRPLDPETSVPTMRRLHLHTFSFYISAHQQQQKVLRWQGHDEKDKWVIDQVWGGDDWILAKFFFFLHAYGLRRTEQAEGIKKGFIIWLSGKFFHAWYSGLSPEWVR